MKIIQISVLTLLLLSITSSLRAQSTQENTEKYWLYRERLNDSFIVVGPGLGESIPAAIYDNFYDLSGPIQWIRVLGWGDATAHLGYYIAMLATEHKLLSITGNSTDSTVRELFYALNALWRLDASSGAYAYDTTSYASGGCYTPNILFQNPMNSSNYHDSNLLDGFFIRDDVPSGFGAHWDRVDTITSDLTIPTNQPNCRAKEMSQDQVTAILLGLICVKEYIPQSLQYNGVPLRDFAILEAMQILKYCKSNGGWHIRNPHLSGSPNVLRGSYGVGFPTAYVYAGLRFDSNNNLTNLHSTLANPTWQALQYPVYLLGESRYVDEPMIANLAAVGNSWGPCPIVLEPLSQYAICLLTTGATVGVTRSGLDRYAARAKEAQYLIHHLLYNSDWSDANNISEASILAMLNSAPCRGPYSPQVFQSPHSTVLGVYGWTVVNRFWGARKTKLPDGHVNDNLMYGKDGSYGQTYNGIDYMLLHNLYYLWRFENGQGNPFEFPYENLQHAIIDHDWPIQATVSQIYNGSNLMPIEVRSIHTITGDHKVKAYPNVPSNYAWHGNVTYRAGDYVDLVDGFEVEYNANFEAYIEPMECVNGQIQRQGEGMSADELLIKSIYDAADAEDDSLHALLLDSLGMTEEQYAVYWDSLYWSFVDSAENQRLAAPFAEAIPMTIQATLFPNPTSSQAILRLRLPTETDVEIRLVNGDGQCNQLIFPMGRLDAGAHDFELSTEKVAAGILKVRIVTATEVLVATLVKQ